MNLADSRTPHSIGFLPFQDHDFLRRGAQLEDRPSVIGVRINGRRIGAGELGHWEYEEGTVGDMAGFMLWPAETRPIGAWRESFPALVPTLGPGGGAGGGIGGDGPAGEIAPDSRVPFDPRDITPNSGGSGGGLTSGSTSGGDGGFDMRPCPPGSGTAETPPREALPIRSTKFDGDERFQRRKPGTPQGAAGRAWPDFPGGTVGLVVPGTEEAEQHDLMLHTDPRLVAPHRGGGPGHGSMVCDLNVEGDFTASRNARLQSVFRVVLAPRGGLSWETNRENVVALNIGGTGLRDTVGGLVVDGCGSGQRIGHLSVRDGGPLDAGGGDEDQHVYAQTADGHPVTPAHLSGLAFWRMHRHDAPMKFEREPYVPPYLFPYLAFTYLRHDGSSTHQWPRDTPTRTGRGLWRWETLVPLGATETPGGPEPQTPGDTTPKDPPPPPIPGGPTTPGGGIPGPGTGGPGTGNPNTGGGGGTGGGVHYTITDSGGGRTKRHTLMTHREMAFPGWAARPQHVQAGERDLRYTSLPNEQEMADLRDRTPVSARLEAYGAQEGGGGPWAYTQSPETSRASGGTVPGGLVLLPPELDVSDALATFAPAGVTTSETHLVIGPGATLSFGTPDLDTGGVKTAYRVDHDSGDLIFKRVDSSGTATEAVKFEADGDYSVQLGDAGGSRKFTVKDLGGSSVAFVGSQGDAEFKSVKTPLGGTMTQTHATADATLDAYTADVESSAYTGAADGEAKLSDLNDLRVAYENLRVHTEDLAQFVNYLVDQLQLGRIPK